MPEKLTEQDRRVLATLAVDDKPMSSTFARAAGIRTQSPRETVARHCIRLTKLGLAEKQGTRMFPTWAITDAGRALLQSEDGR